MIEIDTDEWKTPAHMLALYLISQLAGLTFGENVFVSEHPDSPAQLLAFYDNGGPEQTANIPLDTHFIQIISRSEDYTAGYNLLNSAKVILQSAADIFVSTERIVGVWVTSNIASMGKDHNNLSLFSCNFRVIIETNKDANRDGSPLTQVIGGGNPNTIFDDVIG